jgi:hypothetical protein
MSQREIIIQQQNNPRFAKLQECERRIEGLCRRTVQDARAIGRELMTIRDEELYRESLRIDGQIGYDTWTDYVEIELEWDPRAVQRLINISLCAANLEAAGLELPRNESQIAELARLPAAEQAPTYEEIIAKCEKADLPLTIQIIHDRVAQKTVANGEPVKAPQKPRPRKKKAKEGIIVPDMNEDLAVAAASPPETTAKNRLTLDDRGERALLKIKRLCGESTGQALEWLVVPITQKDLERWADLDDEMVKLMAHYIVNMRWTLSQALKYEHRSEDADRSTTIEELINWAHSRGGYYALQVGKAIITVTVGD